MQYKSYPFYICTCRHKKKEKGLTVKLTVWLHMKSWLSTSTAVTVTRKWIAIAYLRPNRAIPGLSACPGRNYFMSRRLLVPLTNIKMNPRALTSHIHKPSGQCNSIHLQRLIIQHHYLLSLGFLVIIQCIKTARHYFSNCTEPLDRMKRRDKAGLSSSSSCWYITLNL